MTAERVRTLAAPLAIGTKKTLVNLLEKTVDKLWRYCYTYRKLISKSG